MTATCHPPFALTRLAFPEMTRLAVLPVRPPIRAVLMRFDRDDALNLNDNPKTWNLPRTAPWRS